MITIEQDPNIIIKLLILIDNLHHALSLLNKIQFITFISLLYNFFFWSDKLGV